MESSEQTIENSSEIKIKQLNRIQCVRVYQIIAISHRFEITQTKSNRFVTPNFVLEKEYNFAKIHLQIVNDQDLEENTFFCRKRMEKRSK